MMMQLILNIKMEKGLNVNVPEGLNKFHAKDILDISDVHDLSCKPNDTIHGSREFRNKLRSHPASVDTGGRVQGYSKGGSRS